MIEIIGNLWVYPTDYRIITTNGTIKKDGAAVLGRGCALQAKNKYPNLSSRLGRFLMINGNLPYFDPEYSLWTFPVKHQWYEKADLVLIKESCGLLYTVTKNDSSHKYLMVRPGCGNGQLNWEDVKPIVSMLPDNVTIINLN